MLILFIIYSVPFADNKDSAALVLVSCLQKLWVKGNVEMVCFKPDFSCLKLLQLWVHVAVRAASPAYEKDCLPIFVSICGIV